MIHKMQELRIGNWIGVEASSKCGTDLIYRKIVGVDFINHPMGLEPIPLTHEILEKCGLETNNGILYEKKETGFQYDYTDRRLWTGKLGGIGYQKGTCVYLHQLQNLYFALTNTELEINL